MAREAAVISGSLFIQVAAYYMATMQHAPDTLLLSCYAAVSCAKRRWCQVREARTHLRSEQEGEVPGQCEVSQWRSRVWCMGG